MPVAIFLVIIIPVVAIICLVLALRRDPRVANRNPHSVTVMPKSPLSRQVFKATKPPRARPGTDDPTAGPPAGPGKVAPFRPPRRRAG